YADICVSCRILPWRGILGFVHCLRGLAVSLVAGFFFSFSFCLAMFFPSRPIFFAPLSPARSCLSNTCSLSNMPTSISLCMVVKNEEQLIGASLASIRSIVAEMIVVDTGSTDKTPSIATAAGARVIHYPWDGSLGRARNAYLSAARGAWILILDGD